MNKPPFKRITVILDKLNIAKHVCHHMVGENHSLGHRIFVGAIVMVVGVSVSKIHTEYHIVHMMYDGIGYLLHGIGAAPLAVS